MWLAVVHDDHANFELSGCDHEWLLDIERASGVVQRGVCSSSGDGVCTSPPSEGKSALPESALPETRSMENDGARRLQKCCGRPIPRPPARFKPIPAQSMCFSICA